jgi:hypothetical protein
MEHRMPVVSRVEPEQKIRKDSKCSVSGAVKDHHRHHFLEVALLVYQVPFTAASEPSSLPPTIYEYSTTSTKNHNNISSLQSYC